MALVQPAGIVAADTEDVVVVARVRGRAPHRGGRTVHVVRAAIVQRDAILDGQIGPDALPVPSGLVRIVHDHLGDVATIETVRAIPIMTNPQR